ncbi:hypothetical protein OHB12_25025 [Nocardia sp. NBC_01730]|uniref:hypothetical protein n=1 Tax=Nocardia sp. NBC_01730 TaxID=2975998 RepID=UPI002E0D3030|nr:hypothetical protein OHB12_25025 [Nocardia sp. NBC_01730]
MATRSVPQPPFTADLLADLHAGNVTPEQREQLWPVVSRDPEALRFLRSLDDVTAELRALGRDEHIIHAMPGDVAAQLARVVDELDLSEPPTEPRTAIHRLSSGSEAESDGESMVSQSVPAPLVSLDERRHSRRRWLAAAAAIAMVACAGVAVTTLRDDDDVAPTAQPTVQPTAGNNDELGDDLTATAALSALGRHDISGSLARPGALDRCVHANGLDRAVLGSTDIRFQGRDAVLILLPGPRPPKITALVVGTGCRTDDPQRRALQDIG